MAKFVPQKMSDFKIFKLSILHQPPEVVSSHCLLAVKRGRIEGVGQLFGQVVVNLLSHLQAVVFGNLTLGVLSKLSRSRSIILHAKAKVLANFQLVLSFNAASECHKSVNLS